MNTSDFSPGEVRDILRELLAEGQQFDLMFFDADKQENVEYYKVRLSLTLCDVAAYILASFLRLPPLEYVPFLFLVLVFLVPLNS